MENFSHGDRLDLTVQIEKIQARSQNIVTSGGGLVKLAHVRVFGTAIKVLED
jgi:hypothetical protein